MEKGERQKAKGERGKPNQLNQLIIQNPQLKIIIISFRQRNRQGYDKRRTLAQQLAEQGYADAQVRLGLLYGAGLGVQQDWIEAYAWLHLAAMRGGFRFDAAYAAELRNTAARTLSRRELAKAKKHAAQLKKEIESRQHQS